MAAAIRSLARLLGLTVYAGALFTVGGVYAQSEKIVNFNITAPDLASALNQFAQQSDRQIVFGNDVGAGRRVPPLQGPFEPRKALDALLSGSGLSYRITGDDTIVVFAGAARTAANDAIPQSGTVAARPTGPRHVIVPPQPPVTNSIDEIVVTATRREETLSRVPVSVSAFSQDALQEANIKSINDLQRSIPGLVFTPGANTVAIRGISSGAGAPTTGVYIDDSPIQLLGIGIGASNPVPIIFDLERVEVLRGPQGTLFGAGAEGGVVRYITPAPSLTDWSALAKAELGFITHGSQDFEAGVGVGGPVVQDRVGFRASAFFRRSGGWVDALDFRTNDVDAKNVNTVDTAAGRFALLVAPADNLRITPAIQYQRLRSQYGGAAGAAGSASVYEYHSDPANGVYNYAGTQTVPGRDTWYMPTLEIEYDFANVATLTSNTTYFDRKQQGGYDGGEYYLNFYNGLRGSFVAPYTNVPLLSTSGFFVPIPGYVNTGTTANNQRTFSQEVRLASNNPDSPLTWVGGVFYSKTRTFNIERLVSPDDEELLLTLFGTSSFLGPDPYVGFWGLPMIQPGNISYFGDYTIRDSQIAGFGEVSYNITEALKLTVGARYSKTKFSFVNAQGGPLNGEPTGGTGSQEEKPFTPKFGISYQLDDANMLYATIAKGFRIGGANAPVPQLPCQSGFDQLGITSAPTTYDADTTWSYEIGSKNRILDGRVQLASSAFYVKWDGIQQATSIPICFFRFINNAATAVSKGFDLQVNATVFPALSMDLSLGYTDAKYTKDVIANPLAARPFLVQDGTPLPGPDWKVSLGLQYDFNMLERDFFVRGDWFYSSQPSGFQPQQDPLATAYDATIPAAPATDYFTARAGVNLGSFDLSLFVDNLLNSTERLSRSHAGDNNPIYTFTAWRPRTYVFSARYRY